MGAPLWTLPTTSQIQAVIWGSVFLGAALVTGILAVRPGGMAIVSAGAAIALCFSGGFGVLSLLSEARHSRWVSILSMGFGATLLVLPFILGRRLRAGTAGLAVAGAALGWFGTVVLSRTPPTVEQHRATTGLYPVLLTQQRGLVDSNETWGGAIEAVGKGFLLVTGEGEFYRLEWETRDRLGSRELSLRAPFDRREFLADTAGMRSLTRLRVTDLVVDTTVQPGRLYLVHQFWHPAGQCLTLRVSRTTLPAEAQESPPWETVYETRPCLSMVPGFQDTESGGELAWDQRGNLLLSVGDHGLNGVSTPAALAQDTEGDYGKILRLDGAGGARIVSMGHRNPQGLAVDTSGRIWNSEHGPQGGDEINLVVQGGNYGWPHVSYGTQYGLGYWPPARDLINHTGYQEPALAFVPSVAIGSLIQVAGRHFANWRGDLLAGSLRGQRLFRLRVRDGQIIYTEPIRVGRRVRDLAEGADGRIVLWTDEGDLIIVSIASGSPDGSTLYGQCAACHGDQFQGTALGPPLRGVVDRRIASVPGFSYSPALRRREGIWNVARLDSFLVDPERFVRGTSMQFPGIPEWADRRRLIEFIRGGT